MYGPDLAPRPWRQTSFASRVLPVAPSVAVAAFDEWLVTQAATPGHGAHLVVDPESVRRSDTGPWRAVEATMRSPRGRVVARVALELAPWSPTRSELGLRLVGLPRASVRTYFDMAHAVLDVCAAGLREERRDAA